MATQTCAVAQTATLSTTTADTISFTGRGKCLAVQNKHATEYLYFRIDGTTAVGSADDNYSVAPGKTLILSGGVYGGSGSISVVGNANIYTVMIHDGIATG